jgi:hypothetical protein
MKQKVTIFLLSGFVAGVISVVLGKTTPVLLAYGVGPLFFAAIISSLAITGAWDHVGGNFLRYFACLILSTITYVAALFTFSLVAGFSPDWVGVRRSANLLDFGIDIWLGLIAAGIVGAIGISAFTALLTRSWSTSLLLRLMLAGFLPIVVAFITNLTFYSYWSFFGVLLPLGNALFCWIIGLQVLESGMTKRAEAQTPGLR